MYLNIGIDDSKNKHDACILNENGEQIWKIHEAHEHKNKFGQVLRTNKNNFGKT